MPIVDMKRRTFYRIALLDMLFQRIYIFTFDLLNTSFQDSLEHFV